MRRAGILGRGIGAVLVGSSKVRKELMGMRGCVGRHDAIIEMELLFRVLELEM